MHSLLCLIPRYLLFKFSSELLHLNRNVHLNKSLNLWRALIITVVVILIFRWEASSVHPSIRIPFMPSP